MGGDSRPRGRGFECEYCMEFFSYIVVNNYNVCSKIPKINDKRGRGWPIKKIMIRPDTPKSVGKAADQQILQK